MGVPELRQTTCRTLSSRGESLLPKNMRSGRDVGGEVVKIAQRFTQPAVFGYEDDAYVITGSVSWKHLMELLKRLPDFYQKEWYMEHVPAMGGWSTAQVGLVIDVQSKAVGSTTGSYGYKTFRRLSSFYKNTQPWRAKNVYLYVHPINHSRDEDDEWLRDVLKHLHVMLDETERATESLSI